MSIYEYLGMCSKTNFQICEIVSVWMRNFWEMLENASVEGEHFKLKTVFSVQINVDVG